MEVETANELIVGGLFIRDTVTVEVTEPELFVAVRVYIVVEPIVTVVVPLVAVDVEVNPPGDTETDVAPAVTQVRVEVESVDVGLATNDVIEGGAVL